MCHEMVHTDVPRSCSTGTDHRPTLYFKIILPCNTQVPGFPRALFNVEHSRVNIKHLYMTLTLHVIHVCTHVPGVYPGTL
jgi:hypothetical protein